MNIFPQSLLPGRSPPAKPDMLYIHGFGETSLSFQSALIIITGAVFQKVAISVFGCLISPTAFPKHFANERNQTFPFDPSSSSGFNLRSSLSWRQTAEPSGRTAFLQTLPTKCGDVSFFILTLFRLLFFCHSFSLHAPLTAYQPIDLCFSINPPQSVPF